MIFNNQISRRSLLNIFWAAPILALYKFLNPKKKEKDIISIPINTLPYNGVYLIKDKHIGIVQDYTGIKVLNISCTHLGCMLNAEDYKLICPCHGSMFDLNGNVLRGPAKKPLLQVNYKIIDNNIVIEV